MDPLSIIKEFDIIKDGASGLRQAFVPMSVYFFFLQSLEKRLDWCIVVAVSKSTVTWNDLVLGQKILDRLAKKLQTAVRV